MEKQENVIMKEVKTIAMGTAVCAAVMCLVFLAAGYFSTGVILGAVMGSCFAVGNFWYLGKTIERMLNGGDAKKLQSTYVYRLGIHAACVILALKIPAINPIAGIVPLFFPRITIFFMQMTGKYDPDKSFEPEKTETPAEGQTLPEAADAPEQPAAEEE